MTERITSWAEALAFLSIALGIAYLVSQVAGVGWAAITFGTVILCMSAVLTALSRRRGGNV